MSATSLGALTTVLIATGLLFNTTFNEARHKGLQPTAPSPLDSRLERELEKSVRNQFRLRKKASCGCAKWDWKRAVHLPEWPNPTLEGSFTMGLKLEYMSSKWKQNQHRIHATRSGTKRNAAKQINQAQTCAKQLHKLHTATQLACMQ